MNDASQTMTIVACPALPFGLGAWVVYLLQIVDELRAAGRRVEYFRSRPRRRWRSLQGHAIRQRWLASVMRFTPIRFAARLAGVPGVHPFPTRAVARHLPPGFRAVVALPGRH